MTGVSTQSPGNDGYDLRKQNSSSTRVNNSSAHSTTSLKKADMEAQRGDYALDSLPPMPPTSSSQSPDSNHYSNHNDTLHVPQPINFSKTRTPISSGPRTPDGMASDQEVALANLDPRVQASRSREGEQVDKLGTSSRAEHRTREDGTPPPSQGINVRRDWSQEVGERKVAAGGI